MESMRKLVVGIAILLSLGAPAAAEDKMVVDMSKMTCRELTKLGFQDFAGITMWLSGYYNGQRGNTVIDTETLAAQTSTLQDFCLHNAKVPVTPEAGDEAGGGLTAH